MSKRYVARVPMFGRPGRGRSRRDAASVARGVATPPAGAAVAEGVAPVPDDAAAVPAVAAPLGDSAVARGVATPPAPPAGESIDGSTQLLQTPDVTAAIFVDRSGRRGRRLRRVAYALVALALLLLVALWVSQGVVALGLQMSA